MQGLISEKSPENQKDLQSDLKKKLSKQIFTEESSSISNHIGIPFIEKNIELS